VKFIIIAVASVIPLLSSAQSWERITLNINHQTGVELTEFSETYEMIYKGKQLGLESRPKTVYTVFGLGYNFFLTDKLLINPNLGLGIMEHQTDKGLGMGVNLQLAYSFSGKMNFPIYLSGSFGNNLLTNSPTLKSVSFGLGSKVYSFDGSIKNLWLFSCGPTLSFQNELYWGIALKASISLGSLLSKKQD
jgi:hypothetical protein